MDEEESLKKIFSDFNPGAASPSDQFMERLSRKLDAVDAVRSQLAADRRHTCVAVAVAAAAGFVGGSALTLAIGHGGWLANVLMGWSRQAAMVGAPLLGGISAALLQWLIIGAATMIVALSVYDLTLSLVKSRR